MTSHNAAAIIEVLVGLFAVYIIAQVVAHLWVYGIIPDLISPLVLRLK